MKGDAVLRRMREAGLELYNRGMVATKSGNMSVRVDDCVFITAHGSMLGRLGRNDIIELDLDSTGVDDRASTDAGIHLEIFRSTSWNAVVHAHPVFTTALSLRTDEINPLDIEGLYYFPKVPVIPWNEKVERKMGRALKDRRIAVARAHGTYAGAEDIDEALFWTTSLEHSCKLLYLDKALTAWSRKKDDQE